MFGEVISQRFPGASKAAHNSRAQGTRGVDGAARDLGEHVSRTNMWCNPLTNQFWENTTHLANDKPEQIYGPNGIHTKKTLANRRVRELANKNGTATKVHISKN